MSRDVLLVPGFASNSKGFPHFGDRRGGMWNSTRGTRMPDAHRDPGGTSASGAARLGLGTVAFSPCFSVSAGQTAPCCY